MPDSYDQLAESIERVIRTDLPPAKSPEELAGFIDRIMIEEARAGALRLAWLRVLLAVPVVALALIAVALRPVDQPIARSTVAAAASAAWLAIGVWLALAARRGWYRRWIPHVMPFVDATAITAVFVVPSYIAGVSRTRDMSTAALACLVAMCAFLSMSGALRLSRSSSRIGTALAVVVFLLAAATARLDPLAVLVVAGTLVGTGLLGASVTVLIRRLVTDEVAKSTLSRMYEEASQTIEAREQVLKIVSHDLRNPLHTIAMSASLLLDVPLAADQQAGHLKRIKRAGERMNRLVQDLLDVAKLEAGRVGINARLLDVEPLLREAHEMLAPLAEEQSITLELDVASELARITADAGRVLQVISNLVGNAIKFTPKGGRIVLRAQPSPGGVHFSVNDTGQGIPPEQLERIFGRFWQADAADRRGIGLGLTIAKGIMDAHGGRLWVESTVGEGTTFHFVLGTVLPASSSAGRERRKSLVTPRAG